MIVEKRADQLVEGDVVATDGFFVKTIEHFTSLGAPAVKVTTAMHDGNEKSAILWADNPVPVYYANPGIIEHRNGMYEVRDRRGGLLWATKSEAQAEAFLLGYIEGGQAYGQFAKNEGFHGRK